MTSVYRKPNEFPVKAIGGIWTTGLSESSKVHEDPNRISVQEINSALLFRSLVDPRQQDARYRNHKKPEHQKRFPVIKFERPADCCSKQRQSDSNKRNYSKDKGRDAANRT